MTFIIFWWFHFHYESRSLVLKACVVKLVTVWKDHRLGQTTSSSQRETLFFSLIIVSNKVPNSAPHSLGAHAPSASEVPRLSSPAQGRPGNEQENSTCMPSTKSFCLLLVFTFGDMSFFEEGWEGKVCPGLLCTMVRQIRINFFFLNPGPQWRGKWIWYRKFSQQFGYIGIPFFATCII